MYFSHACIISSSRCVEASAVIVICSCSLYGVWELGQFGAIGQVGGHRCLGWKGRQRDTCTLWENSIQSCHDGWWQRCWCPFCLDVCNIRDCRITMMDFNLHSISYTLVCLVMSSLKCNPGKATVYCNPTLQDLYLLRDANCVHECICSQYSNYRVLYV